MRRIHGTNIFSDPSRFVFQLGYIVQGLSESFSWVYFFIGLLPFAFLLTMHKRERSWIIGLTSIYFCLSVLLVILIDVSPGPLLDGFEQGVLHRVARTCLP